MDSSAGPAPVRQVGVVKWFDAQKGWGFIQPGDGTEDIFVHQQSICCHGFRSLGDGENVEFDTEVDPQGRRRAVNVSGPGGAPVKGSSKPMGFQGGVRGNDRGDGGYARGPGGFDGQGGPRGGFNRGPGGNSGFSGRRDFGGFEDNNGGAPQRRWNNEGGRAQGGSRGGADFGGRPMYGDQQQMAAPQQQPRYDNQQPNNWGRDF